MSLKVGVTGGIGSGKSLACEVFSKLGIPVFKADQEVKNLYATNLTVRKNLVLRYGQQIITQDGSVDKTMLAGIIFNSPAELAFINGFIHPVIEQEYIQWHTARQFVPYTIIEAALLIESRLYTRLDMTISVIAPENTRTSRVMKRDGTSELLVLARIKQQTDDETRKKFSQFILINDGKHLILPVILDIHNKLVSSEW
ncbi:MAG: dephospho-CoA kinase [Bacteroidia bacterium]|nr:dephospho-CoA kinase [Bacteroidia bacterium]